MYFPSNIPNLLMPLMVNLSTRSLIDIWFLYIINLRLRIKSICLCKQIIIIKFFYYHYFWIPTSILTFYFEFIIWLSVLKFIPETMSFISRRINFLLVAFIIVIILNIHFFIKKWIFYWKNIFMPDIHFVINLASA